MIDFSSFLFSSLCFNYMSTLTANGVSKPSRQNLMIDCPGKRMRRIFWPPFVKRSELFDHFTKRTIIYIYERPIVTVFESNYLYKNTHFNVSLVSILCSTISIVYILEIISIKVILSWYIRIFFISQSNDPNG